MHQAFDALFEFDKGAEIGNARDRPRDALANLILLGDQIPRVRLQLLESQRNAFLGRVDFEDLRLDLVADVQHIGRLVGRPQEISATWSAHHAADIDEGAVIGEAANGAERSRLP